MSDWVVEGLETDLEAFHLGPVDFTLSPGRAAAILGTSGAGKTTLLRALAGFLPIREGRLLRDGSDISDCSPEERGLGYVPQGLGLFPQRTVFRNVRYPMEVRGVAAANERTFDLLDRFRLTGLRDRRPTQLSGGEQQRVAIARALAAEPELIVWDEPWQALDVEARHDLGRVLADLRATDRIPVVVVTHDPDLAFSVADEFLVLDHGRMSLAAAAHDLLERPANAFVARFAGYENVFDRAVLEAGRTRAFAGWLLERAGPLGVALRCPVAALPIGEPSTWEGVVRSVRPDPDGVRLEVAVDDLMVAVRLPRPWPAPVPTAGARLRFNVDEGRVRPLGAGTTPAR